MFIKVRLMLCLLYLNVSGKCMVINLNITLNFDLSVLNFDTNVNKAIFCA
jgi:hypothetical protein